MPGLPAIPKPPIPVPSLPTPPALPCGIKLPSLPAIPTLTLTIALPAFPPALPSGSGPTFPRIAAMIARIEAFAALCNASIPTPRPQ